MYYSVKQIGERLKGLREVLNVPIEEVAELCGISVDFYKKIEAGKADPSVYRLMKISRRYGISLDVLLFGEEPRMNEYFVTRANKGLTVSNSNDYKYQSLGSGFRHRKAEPFLVQLNPLPEGKNHHKNIHEGQEFDYVMSGVLEVTLEGKVLTLEAGDSIYFDTSKEHCMRCLNGEPCKFICIVI